MAAARKAQKIGAKTTASAAVRSLMTTGAAGFSRQLRVLMQTDEPEGPHKSRVALRRLRVALSAFKPVVDSRTYRDLQDSLRATFRTIGPLRDADVLAFAMNQPDLFAAAAQTRTKVRAALVLDRASRLGDRITRIFAGKDSQRPGTKSIRNAPVTPLAAKALQKAWDTCLAFGPDLINLPPTTRHELRKSLKTLRYLCDDFAILWPGPTKDAFLAQLRPLQDDLGTLNDHALARSRGFAVPEDAPTLAAAQSHWTTLLNSPLWW